MECTITSDECKAKPISEDARREISKFGDPDAIKNWFWGKVNARKPHECWTWTGWVNKKGYASTTFNARNGSQPHASAHRLSYLLNMGHIPPTLLVCHKCDNPPCVNPNHLFLGTARDNAVDRSLKGRGVGERHALHKLSEADVIAIRRYHTPIKGNMTLLANIFGVNHRTIYAVIKRILWKHIE